MGMVPNGKRVVLAKRLKSMVGRSTHTKVDCVQSMDGGCTVTRSFFRGRSVRIRVPRNTIPGSKPSTKVAVTATVLSTIANGGIHTSLTVAKRVALENHMLPVKKLGRGLLTTGGTKVRTMLIPGRGVTSIRRLSSRVAGNLRVVPIRAVRRILGGTLAEWGSYF